MTWFWGTRYIKTLEGVIGAGGDLEYKYQASRDAKDGHDTFGNAFKGQLAKECRVRSIGCDHKTDESAYEELAFRRKLDFAHHSV